MKFLSCLFYFFLVFEPICFAQKANSNILITEPSKPGIPTNIVVNSLDGRNLRISWNGISANGYELAYKLKSANEWTTVKTSKNAAEINTSNLGGIYQIKVRNLDPKSSGLDFSNITEYLKPTPCPKPGKIRHFNSSPGTVMDLEWDTVLVNGMPAKYEIKITNIETGKINYYNISQTSLKFPFNRNEEGYIIEVRTICSDGVFSEPSILEIETNRCSENINNAELAIYNLVNFFGIHEAIETGDCMVKDPDEIYNKIETSGDIDRFHYFMPDVSQNTKTKIQDILFNSTGFFLAANNLRDFCVNDLPKGRLIVTLEGMTKDYDLYLRDAVTNEIIAQSTRTGTQTEYIKIQRDYWEAYYIDIDNDLPFTWSTYDPACYLRNSFYAEVVPKNKETDFDSLNCYKLVAYYLQEDVPEDCEALNYYHNLKAKDITNTSMKITWDRVVLAKEYVLQYKKNIDDGLNWTTITTTDNSVLLTGLSQGTEYVIRLKVVCVLFGESDFEYIYPKTTGACVDFNEPNNTPQQATWLGVNNELFGSIGSSSDQDFFQFPSPGKTIHLSLENLPADYDLYLHDQAGNYLAWSTNTGLNSESITYTNNNYYGMYSVRVQNRIAGQYDPNECYKLKYWTSQNRLMDPNTNAVNEMNISLFPNPNNGHFVVNYTALVTKNTTVNIFDIYGKLVNSTDFTLNEGQNTLELNLDNLSNGIYFLSATDEPLQRQKFIISK